MRERCGNPRRSLGQAWTSPAHTHRRRRWQSIPSALPVWVGLAPGRPASPQHPSHNAALPVSRDATRRWPPATAGSPAGAICCFLPCATIVLLLCVPRHALCASPAAARQLLGVGTSVVWLRPLPLRDRSRHQLVPVGGGQCIANCQQCTAGSAPLWRPVSHQLLGVCPVLAFHLPLFAGALAGGRVELLQCLSAVVKPLAANTSHDEPSDFRHRAVGTMGRWAMGLVLCQLPFG
jgi:hypothetical protein